MIGSGLTARHSGSVRSANADPAAAALAGHAAHMWRNLEMYWGVPLAVGAAGAVWIANSNAQDENPKWQALQAGTEAAGVAFGKVAAAHARDLCPPIVKLNVGEVYYHEPDAMQNDPVAVRTALHDALKANGVEVREKAAVTEFKRAEDGRVQAVMTSAGLITCDHVVNACGP